MLKDSELSEWEVLSQLYSRYRLTPGAKEFRKVVDSLVVGGYANFEPMEGGRKLRVTKVGVKLFQRLDGEYQAIVSNINQSQDRDAAAR
jgi:hypothetical protein